MSKLDKFEHLLERVFNIMAFTRTVITIIIFGIMISQLFSCTAPPQLPAYEQHKYDVEMYRNMKTLEGISHNELQDMWGTLYIEAQLTNMEYR
jgi:hypothetical protein